MNTAASFPLSLDYEGKHYAGTITPSEDVAITGMPVYFRVKLGDDFFAYLCCSDHGWQERDKEGQHSGLIQAIGDYIADYYE
jgi:hypothetical protein